MTEIPSKMKDENLASSDLIPSIRSVSPLTRIPMEENEQTSNQPNRLYSSTGTSLNTSIRSYTDESPLDDGETNERQPLLVVRSSEPVDELAKDYVSYENNKAFVYILLILLGLAFLFYLTFQQLDSLVLLAIDTKFQSLSIMELNQDGINSHVVGSISMHYGNIGNHFYRFFMKFASVIIGSVIIIPNNAVKLFASIPDSNDSLHILNIYPPNLQVDIANNALTEIDFISKTELMKENIVQLLNRLENIDDKKIPVKVTGVFNSTIESKLFQYSTKNARFYVDYDLNKTDLKPTVQVDNLIVQQNVETNKDIELSSTITLDNNFPIKVDLDSIDWDVSLEDCQQRLVKFGNWKSSRISIQPDSPVVFNVSGVLPEIPNELYEYCSNNVTIINKLIQDYLQNKPTSININASNNERNLKTLPKWLLYILNNSKYRLDISLPNFDGDIMGSIRDFNMASLFFEVLLQQFSETFSYAASSNTTVASSFPGIFKIDVAASNIQNSINLRQESDLLVVGRSNGNNNMHLTWNDEEKFLEWNIGVDYFEGDVIQPAELGKLTNRLLHDQEKRVPIYADIFIEEVDILMPILNTTLRNLELPSIQLTHPESINTIGDIIDSLNVTVDNITYIDSSNELITLLVDTRVLNPTNISVDIPNDTLSFQILYNDTIIGTVSTTDLFIPQTDDYIDSIFIFTLNSTTAHGKLENFVGKVISGYEDLHLSVKGSNASSTNNKGLGDFLGAISVDNIPVPNVTFSHPQLQNLPRILDHLPQHQSPFLIEAIIHFFSSELELVLFNPLLNAEIVVDIFEAQASYENTKLGHVQPNHRLTVSPGIYKSPRIPFAMETGIGMDILRKALNGSLRVQVLAVFKATIGEFDLLLLYEGSDLSAAIRW